MERGGGGLLGANRTEPKQISFRVSDTEYRRLKAIADNLGISVPAFCKARAQKARLKQPQIDREGARKIAVQIGKIGNNINQMAKKLHLGQSAELDQLRKMEDQLHQIGQLIQKELK